MKKALKTKERLSIIEAVDILSSLSELNAKLVFSDGQFIKGDLHPERWLEEDRIAENEEIVQEAFESVRHYLEQMHKKHLGQFTDPQVQKGIEAILTIVREGTEKLVQLTGLFRRGIAAKSLFAVKEYQQMIECIESRILPHMPKKKRKHHQEKEDFFIAEEDSELKEQLEEIKQDEQYDLFYIKKESGHPFYDQECLRKLQLLYDFEKMGEEGNHFLQNLQVLQARDFQKRAAAILAGADSLVREFYKVSLKGKSSVWSSSLSKALMSLMLAATPHSVASQGEIARTATEYFADFRDYLREALESSEYLSAMQEEKLSALEKKFALLTHKLCFSYFLSISLEKEMSVFLKELIGYKKEKASSSEILEHEDRALRDFLHKTPNGPIKKIVAAFLRGDFEEGWDPLAQGCAPTRVFSFISKKQKVEVLHMPAPIKQFKVHQARIVKEFNVFLQECVHAQDKKILLIDLQDATSFIEHPRIETFQALLENKGGYTSILRLAKNTDFYFQQNEYHDVFKAVDFFKLLEEQILIGGACGFAFPKAWGQKQTIEFIQGAFEFIHQVFFENKKELSIQERKDFIEVFYVFIALKTIELEKPDYIAFISKDGLDSAVSFGSEIFFAMKSFFCSHTVKEKDQDFLFWWLYAPVLMLRERVTHKKEIERTIRFIQKVESGIKKCKGWEKLFSKLIDKDFIQDVEIYSN